MGEQKTVILKNILKILQKCIALCGKRWYALDSVWSGCTHSMLLKLNLQTQ